MVYSGEKCKMTRGDKMKKVKTIPKKPKPASKVKNTQTREKILKAAQEVFANYPYHTASIRMIGKLAEIEHPLISYYFPSKADLFRSVLTELMAYRSKMVESWDDEIKQAGPARGLSLFLDHTLDDFRNRPGLLHIISLNLSRPTNSDPIPGYDLIQEFVESSTKSSIKLAGLGVPLHEWDMFSRTMTTLLIGYLGASSTYAPLIGKDPDSILYYNWVKDTIIYTLLPRLEQMVKKKGADD
jgi:AcrR family transcriptional regulator